MKKTSVRSRKSAHQKHKKPDDVQAVIRAANRIATRFEQDMKIARHAFERIISDKDGALTATEMREAASGALLALGFLDPLHTPKGGRR